MPLRVLTHWATVCSAVVICTLSMVALSQEQRGAGPFGGPGRGPGGPGGMMGQERKLVAQFDKDDNGRLNRQERQAAREFLKNERAAGGGRGFGPPGGFGPPQGGGFG